LRSSSVSAGHAGGFTEARGAGFGVRGTEALRTGLQRLLLVTSTGGHRSDQTNTDFYIHRSARESSPFIASLFVICGSTARPGVKFSNDFSRACVCAPASERSRAALVDQPDTPVLPQTPADCGNSNCVLPTHPEQSAAFRLIIVADCGGGSC
jgi:hypothetical protein